ncbi:MAG: RNA-binding protein [Candidatus Poribacteria bacterium]|nr:RNA-binding protein [Candidatus Poribacteria bacterium]
MNIYVGNVPYAATETDLEELFEPHGPLSSVTIIRDRYDGRSKGYGFVEMENQEDGERAIEALDGQEVMGRPLKVNPARPRERRSGGGGGGGRYQSRYEEE